MIIPKNTHKNLPYSINCLYIITLNKNNNGGYVSAKVFDEFNKLIRIYNISYQYLALCALINSCILASIKA